jgi:hypothetical protein
MQQKQHLGGRQFHINEEAEMVVNAKARFLPWRNILTRTKMRIVHRCAQGFCWEIMILQWNNRVTFNSVMISHLICMASGTLLILPLRICAPNAVTATPPSLSSSLAQFCILSTAAVIALCT